MATATGVGPVGPGETLNAPTGTASPSYPSWVYELAAAIRVPASPTNLEALYLWGQSEATAAQNNPLAVSTKFPGATKCISQCGSASPVYAYETPAAGVAANAAFINNGYSSVTKVMRNGGSLADIWTAINRSAWCKGCQNGLYPVKLHQATGGAPGTVAGGGSTGTLASAVGTVDLSACVIGNPIPFIGGCLLTKGGVKWLKGAAAITAGGFLGLVGVLMIASAGFEMSGAGKAVGKATSLVPGGGLAKTVTTKANARAGSLTATGKSAPPKPKPLTDQDFSDLNAEMATKRQKAEGPSPAVRQYQRERTQVRRYSRPHAA